MSSPHPHRRAFQRFFGAAFGAVLFLVTGAIGYNLNVHMAWRSGTRWTAERPIWGQLAIGAAFLVLAVLSYRRLMRELSPDWEILPPDVRVLGRVSNRKRIPPSPPSRQLTAPPD